mgnify:CR=1 FL=1
MAKQKENMELAPYLERLTKSEEDNFVWYKTKDGIYCEIYDSTIRSLNEDFYVTVNGIHVENYGELSSAFGNKAKTIKDDFLSRTKSNN